jgi:hypothetical protein
MKYPSKDNLEHIGRQDQHDNKDECNHENTKDRK